MPEVEDIDEWIVHYDDKKMLEMGISASAAADAVQKAIHGHEQLSNVVLESANGKKIRLSDLAEIKDFLSHGRCFRQWSVDINGHWRDQPWLKFTLGRKPKVVEAIRKSERRVLTKGEEMLLHAGTDLFRPDSSDPAQEFNSRREMIEDRAKAMGIPAADVPEKMSQGIMDRMFPDAFRVSAEESVQMEKGRLDRDAIKREIAEDIKFLGQMRVTLPDIGQRLIDRFLAGKTNADMELEFTRRF